MWTNPQAEAMDTYMTRTKTGIKGKKRERKMSAHKSAFYHLCGLLQREKRANYKSQVIAVSVCSSL